MKNLPNRRENGKFASKTYISKAKLREERYGKIIAFTIVFAVIVIFIVGLHGIAVWVRMEAHRAWDRMVAQQEILYEKAMEVAMPPAFAGNEEQEPSKFIPSKFVKENVPVEILPEFIEYAGEYKVPADTMAKIISAESSFNPKAYHKNKKGLGADYGWCQSNDLFWKKKIESKGLTFGGLEGCFYIYSIAGSEAWNPSKHVWLTK